MTWPYNIKIPLLQNVCSQAPWAICELRTTNSRGTLIVNQSGASFDNPDIQRTMALALDRKGFIDILAHGQAKIGGVMLPPPDGIWGMPYDQLKMLPGDDLDVQKNRAEARKIMQNLGYRRDRQIKVKFATRNTDIYKAAAVILSDQLREIFIDSELDVIETANWFTKLARKDYQVGFELMGGAVDDPDALLYQNYGCGGELNYSVYCNHEIEKLFEQQSMKTHYERRRELVWEIEQKLLSDGARSIIHHTRAATCWQPKVKGLTTMVNSVYNGWRMEDVWLDN